MTKSSAPWIAIGLCLLAAMLDAQRSGTGCDVDVDLLSVAAHQMSYPAVWYLNEGDVTPRAPRSAPILRRSRCCT